MKFRLSIIIPVFREADVINRMIAHLLALQGADALEILVVDGDRHGDTLRAIRFDLVKKIAASKGRGGQMNRGAAEATGDILLFVHADTFLPPDAYPAIRRAMTCQNIAGGAFCLGIQSNRKVFRIIEYAANFRSNRLRLPYGDQAIFVRNTFFRKIGGYQDIPLMEDVALMRRIQKHSGRIILLPLQVQTSPRRWEKEGILRCTLRNWTLLVLYYAGVSPQKLVRFYS